MTAGTPPFELPASARLPGGRDVTGTRARVYWLLRLTGERNHSHVMDTQPPVQGPPGWTPIHTLRAPWAGGAQGDRRVRDLQEEYGVSYEVRRWSELGGPRESAATLYRLKGDPLAALNPGVTAGRHPAKAAPMLARLRFWTAAAAGRPADASCLLCIDPGLPHGLAPSLELARRVDAGELTRDQADAAYREELLVAYRRGAFAIITGSVHLVLWTSRPAAAWCPLPALSRALIALGATHEGVWQGRAA